MIDSRPSHREQHMRNVHIEHLEEALEDRTKEIRRLVEENATLARINLTEASAWNEELEELRSEIEDLKFERDDLQGRIYDLEDRIYDLESLLPDDLHRTVTEQ